MKKLLLLVSSFFFLVAVFSWQPQPARAADPIVDSIRAAWAVGGFLYRNHQDLNREGLYKWISKGVTTGILKTFVDAFAGHPVAAGTGSRPATLPLGALPLPADARGQSWRLEGGLLGYLGSFDGLILQTQPASGIYYAQQLWHNLSGQPAYAADSFLFFASMQPLLHFWQVSRNISYLLLSLAFLAAGLGIMLRLKISPQATMSLSNALPRLVAALILITFSYAIAGFILDLMWLTNAAIYHLAQVNHLGGYYTQADLSAIMHRGLFREMKNALWHTGTSRPGLEVGTGYLLVSAIGVIIAWAVGIIASGGTAGLAAIILLFIFIAGLLYIFLKLFVSLIKVFVSLVLLIVFAPFYILAGALPGAGGGFGPWLKDLLANAMVFPALTVGLILLGEFVAPAARSLDDFALPHIGNAMGLPSFLLTLGVVFMLPSIPDTVRRAFGFRGGGIGSEAIAAMAPLIGFAAWGPRKVSGIVQGGAERAAVQRVSDLTKTTGGSLTKALAQNLGLKKNP